MCAKTLSAKGKTWKSIVVGDFSGQTGKLREELCLPTAHFFPDRD